MVDCVFVMSFSVAAIVLPASMPCWVHVVRSCDGVGALVTG